VSTLLLAVEEKHSRVLSQEGQMARDLITARGVDMQLIGVTESTDTLVTPTTDKEEETNSIRLPTMPGESVKDSLRVPQVHHEHHHQIYYPS